MWLTLRPRTTQARSLRHAGVDAEARTVFVVKRGMSAGYSGIKNDLFELANTSMVRDAKKVLGDLLTELKDLGLGKK